MKFVIFFVLLVTSALTSLFFHYKNDPNPTQIPRSVIVYQSEVDNDDDEPDISTNPVIYAN